VAGRSPKGETAPARSGGPQGDLEALLHPADPGLPQGRGTSRRLGQCCSRPRCGRRGGGTGSTSLRLGPRRGRSRAPRGTVGGPGQAAASAGGGEALGAPGAALGVPGIALKPREALAAGGQAPLETEAGGIPLGGEDAATSQGRRQGTCV